jgi:hypothetical protein
MRVVPAGKFPAAALAAAMINQERSEDWFDVDHAAATGNLVELPPERKRFHTLTVSHHGIDTFCRVRSRKGVVFLALFDAEEQRSHLVEVKQILNLYVDHLKQPMVVADVAYHEKAWAKPSQEAPKRIFRAIPSEWQGAEETPGEDFWWGVEPLAKYYRLRKSEHTLSRALVLNQLALVQDSMGRLRPEMQTSSVWFPSFKDLQVPEVRTHECLILHPVGNSATKKLASKFSGSTNNIAWGNWIDPSTGVRLGRVCQPRETRFLLKGLRQHEMCHACQGKLSGICGLIRRRTIDRGEWITLCWVCTGMALYCQSRGSPGTEAWRYLCVYDSGVSIQGYEIEYDPTSAIWPVTSKVDEVLGFVNPTLLQFRDEYLGLTGPRFRDMGSGVLLRPTRACTLVPT